MKSCPQHTCVILLALALLAPAHGAHGQASTPLPPIWERVVELPLRPVEGGPAHLAGPGPAPPPPELSGRDRNPSVWRHLVGRRDLPIPDSELDVLAERDRIERQSRPAERPGMVTPRSLGPAAPR
jgi:hypothetical protein